MSTLRLLPLVIGLASALIVADVGIASATRITGKVTYVGTRGQEQLFANGPFHALLLVRVKGTCDNGPAKDWWLLIRSGRMDAGFEHTGVSMRNAYNTSMAAQLSGKTVEIGDNIPNCATPEGTTLDLWTNFVAMF